MSDQASVFGRSFEGRVALVTGAANGIGRSTALMLAAAGARVAVTDREQEAAEDVAGAINGDGGKARAWNLDVSDGARIAAVVPEIAEHFGGLDIVVNNAGFPSRMMLDDPEFDANWLNLLNNLATSQQRVIRAALPALRQSDAARIVNVASTEALGGTAGNAGYAAGKAAVVGMTRAIAVELGREDITVNCVCPGPVLTRLAERFTEEQREVYVRRCLAIRRYGLAEEIAYVIVALCAPAASFITGTVVPVDGGLMARNV